MTGSIRILSLLIFTLVFSLSVEAKRSFDATKVESFHASVARIGSELDSIHRQSVTRLGAVAAETAGAHSKAATREALATRDSETLAQLDAVKEALDVLSPGSIGLFQKLQNAGLGKDPQKWATVLGALAKLDQKALKDLYLKDDFSDAVSKLVSQYVGKKNLDASVVERLAKVVNDSDAETLKALGGINRSVAESVLSRFPSRRQLADIRNNTKISAEDKANQIQALQSQSKTQLKTLLTSAQAELKLHLEEARQDLDNKKDSPEESEAHARVLALEAQEKAYGDALDNVDALGLDKFTTSLLRGEGSEHADAITTALFDAAARLELKGSLSRADVDFILRECGVKG